MNRTLRLFLAVAVLQVAALSCSKPKEHVNPHGADPFVRSQALLDSGNASFRAKDFASAAKRYASAAVVNPDDPAAFYGLGMALSRLGRDDEARVAYAKARALAGPAGDSAFVTPH